MGILADHGKHRHSSSVPDHPQASVGGPDGQDWTTLFTLHAFPFLAAAFAASECATTLPSRSTATRGDHEDSRCSSAHDRRSGGSGSGLPKRKKELTTHGACRSVPRFADARQKVPGLACQDDKDAGTLCVSTFNVSPHMKSERDAWSFVDCGKFVGAAVQFPVNADLDLRKSSSNATDGHAVYSTTSAWVWRGEHSRPSVTCGIASSRLLLRAFSDYMATAPKSNRAEAASRF